MALATAISPWVIGTAVVGLLLIIPFVMGFFGSNQFDVKGKVRRDLCRSDSGGGEEG